MQKPSAYKKDFHTNTSIFALVLVGMFVSYLFWNLMMPRMDFYNNFWAPAHLLVQGKSPYNTASLNPTLPAVWFPMVVGFFFPLGWLSEKLALQVWFIFNIIEICVIIYFVQGDKRSLYNTMALALLCFFFPFVLNHYNLGQLSVTITLCLILSAHFSNNHRDWSSAFFLALALSKPQLGIIALFGLSILYFRRNGFKGFFYFGIKTLLMALLMCLPLFIVYPTWIPDWIKSMQEIHEWLHPSLFSILRQSMSYWGTFIWALILTLALVISYQLWTKLPPSTAMMWSLGITTIVTPYIWSWDFVLLLPIWIYTFVLVDWKRKVILVIMYLIGWYGMALVQAREISSNDLFWWVPIWFVIGLMLVTNWKEELGIKSTS